MVVTLSDGRRIKNAKLIGADPKSDLAVVKIEADRLIPANGRQRHAGQGDIIMGSAARSACRVDDARHRERRWGGRRGSSAGVCIQNFIQVDAPINRQQRWAAGQPEG